MSTYYKHRARFVFRVCAGCTLAAAATVLIILTCAGFFDRFSWLCDLAVHFRVQYAVALFICAILSGFLRSNRVMIFAWIGLLVNMFVLLTVYWGQAGSDNPDSTHVQVMVLNVNTGNRLYKTVRTAVQVVDPDIFIVEEIDDAWLQELEQLKNKYPYSCVEPRRDNFGIGLFSSYPFVNKKITYIGSAGVPSVHAAVMVDGKKLSVLGTHTVPPGARDLWLYRNEQLDAIASWCVTNTGPLVVAGDLNTTPWSYAFRKLKREAGLSDSAACWRYQPTWPVQTWFMRIPIDHVLCSDGITILRRTVGPDIGSDHLPVCVEFVVNGETSSGVME
jgi:endonuclease/exonuclease/phosphatase (EEP) superfamily protein YafD